MNYLGCFKMPSVSQWAFDGVQWCAILLEPFITTTNLSSTNVGCLKAQWHSWTVTFRNTVLAWKASLSALCSHAIPVTSSFVAYSSDTSKPAISWLFFGLTRRAHLSRQFHDFQRIERVRHQRAQSPSFANADIVIIRGSPSVGRPGTRRIKRGHLLEKLQIDSRGSE